MDIQSHRYVADTDDYIKHYFKLEPEIVQGVYDRMVSGKHYVPGKGWRYEGRALRWSSRKDTEVAFYNYVVAICEAIRTNYESEAAKSAYNCSWSKSPLKGPFFNENTPLIPSSILLFLGDGNARKSVEKLIEFKDESEKFMRLESAWWRKIGVIMQVKRKESDDAVDHVTELMGYLKQVLLKQLDRWFVPGLLLTGTYLSSWMVDRSGAVGMDKSFDINEEPKKFIQIILACSNLPPERLGWDITMKLWKELGPDRCIHSFAERVNLDDYKNITYEPNWVIEMPAANGTQERERFLTTQALSVPEAGCMAGRSTVVWAALKLDNNNEIISDQIFVLKQSWCLLTLMAEGLLYPPAEEAAQHHIGQVYAYDDVQINGITVDTKHFIRGTLKLRPPTAEKKKRTYKESEWQGARDPYLVTVPKRDDAFLSHLSANISVEHRVLSRTLLTDSFGVPLDLFCNLLEFVCVCSHIVEALEYLYFDKKTLQRDISIGNILITSLDDDNIGKGCLVDFDHAKVVTDVKKTLMEEGKCRKEENLKPVEGYLAFVTHYRLHGRSLPPNIAHNLAYGSDPLTLLYLRELTEFVDESTLSNPLKPEDVGLLDESRKEVPDFSQQTPQMAKRCVNLPFASPEILEERPLFPLYSKTRPQHDLRHDIESLFWCMNSICLTRSGPGGKHRDELRADFDGEITEEVRELQHINYTFFSADAKIICSNKVHLFLHPQGYDTFIIPRFHPYFNPLKPLMKKWWEMLRMAHRYPTFETLHLALRRELASVTETLRQTPQEDPRRTAEILSDRHALLARLRTPFIFTTNKSNQVEIGHVVPTHEGTSNLKRNRPSSASTVTEPNKRHKRH